MAARSVIPRSFGFTSIGLSRLMAEQCAYRYSSGMNAGFSMDEAFDAVRCHCLDVMFLHRTAVIPALSVGIHDLSQ
jgi:hypothetical protein